MVKMLGWQDILSHHDCYWPLQKLQLHPVQKQPGEGKGDHQGGPRTCSGLAWQETLVAQQDKVEGVPPPLECIQSSRWSSRASTGSRTRLQCRINGMQCIKQNGDVIRTGVKGKRINTLSLDVDGTHKRNAQTTAMWRPGGTWQRWLPVDSTFDKVKIISHAPFSYFSTIETVFQERTDKIWFKKKTI